MGIATRPTALVLTRAAAARDALHDAAPAGVPYDFDWQLRGITHNGLTRPPDVTAITGWAQVFVTNGHPAARVWAKNIRVWARTAAPGQRRAWHLLQSSDAVSGAIYSADYAGDVSTPQGKQPIALDNGKAWHFYPEHRAKLPLHMDGLVVSFQGRCTPDKSALMGCGADYWQSLQAPWDDGRTNPPLGCGGLRFADARWRTFSVGWVAQAQEQR